MRYRLKNMSSISRFLWPLLCLFLMQNALATETDKVYIEASEKTDQGTCIPLFVQSAQKIELPAAILRDSSGTILARCQGMSIPEEEHRYLFLLPVPTDAKEGIAHIHISGILEGRPFTRMSQVEITQCNFISETIRLNSSNTAIRTDTSERKLDQIQRLTEILTTSRPDAHTFLGPWAAPVTATRRTSLFGDKRIYLYSNGSKSTSIHWGIDFGIPTGTPVFAAGDGIVVMACNRITTGLTVVIEHASGVYSLYYHLDALLADEGEQVRTGTLIGRSGSTGLSTGPHLHWEFRVAGVAVSPDWFIGRTLF